jgi:oligopeptide/dipeptide ABC transporter ATP-binding protein
MSDAALLQVEHLIKDFSPPRGGFPRAAAPVRAVNDVSLSLRRGESLGVVGESGCGKTTLGRLVLRLVDPTGGRIVFNGQDITALPARQLRPLRRRMQIIMQDPYASLDPRMTVAEIVTEPLRAAGGMTRRTRYRAAAGWLEAVGLRATDRDRYPHEFSGGQRQRIGIARAICVRPELIVADEPLSALDVSIQAQIVNLMQDLQNRFALTYLLISHDLNVVGHFCDRIAVMYLGAIVELAPAAAFTQGPRHPYSRLLLSAVPAADPRQRQRPIRFTEGAPADPSAPPPGCAFHPRCPYALAACRRRRPPLVAVNSSHRLACWLDKGNGVSPDARRG